MQKQRTLIEMYKYVFIKIIKNNFKQRDCYTLVIPTNDHQKLRNLEMESKNALRPEFMYNNYVYLGSK